MSAHVFVGNLVADPEFQHTAGGTPVVRFRIACDDVGRDPAGKLIERETVFHAVQAWRTLAERITATVSKGDPVIVVGEFRTASWTTEAGERRSRTYVHATAVGPNLQRAIVDGVRRPTSTPTSSSGASAGTGGAAAVPLAQRTDQQVDQQDGQHDDAAGPGEFDATAAWDEL